MQLEARVRREGFAGGVGSARVMEDETSCGLLCGHPACWQSNMRREKGFPKVSHSIVDSDEEPESDLPVVTVYNMLDEYGEDGKDRFPSSTGGRPKHESRPADSYQHFFSGGENWDISTPEMTPEKPPPKCNFVEVQEVFDVDDLRSRWDEAFMMKQYYVWVPNPKKPAPKEEPKEQRKETLAFTRDMTENMVPEELQRQRENNLLKKSLRPLPRSSIPNRSFSKSAAWAVKRKPVVDTEGINDLLDLPQDVLVRVLEQSKQSDFTSRERLEQIINRVAPTVDRGITQASLTSSELLMQRKVKLLTDKRRNVRGNHIMPTQPVFQLDQEMGTRLPDGERVSSATAPATKDLGSEMGTARETASWKKFPRYRRLPRIGGGKRRSNAKISSVSLGLPELPSGIRSTRTFMYKRRDIDFSLGPVPTPPLSVRSTMSGETEDDSVTMRVNVYSRSEKNFSEVNGVLSKGFEGPSQMVVPHTPLRAVSASSSTGIPTAPHGTPIVFQSPTKGLNFLREVSGTGDESREISVPPPSRETSSPSSFVLPSHMRLDLDAENSGLDTIRETMREQPGILTAERSRSVHFLEETSGHPSASPVAEMPAGVSTMDATANASFTYPAVPADGHQLQTPKTIDSTTSPIKMARGNYRELNPTTSQTEGSSPELWPQVCEAAYEAATPAGAIVIPSPYGTTRRPSRGEPERSVRTPGRTDLGSGGSNREILSRIMGEAQRISESPAPPPPSPEREEAGVSFPTDGSEGSEGKVRSRESVSMMPLIEESEPVDAEHREASAAAAAAAAAAANTEMGYAQTVSSIEPKVSQRRPGQKKPKVVDTFLNVHIPATVDLLLDEATTEGDAGREARSPDGGAARDEPKGSESHPGQDAPAEEPPAGAVMERSQADGGMEADGNSPAAATLPKDITYSTFSSVSKLADSGGREVTRDGSDVEGRKQSPEGSRSADGEPPSQSGSSETRKDSVEQEAPDPPPCFVIGSSGSSDASFARKEAETGDGESAQKDPGNTGQAGSGAAPDGGKEKQNAGGSQGVAENGEEPSAPLRREGDGLVEREERRADGDDAVVDDGAAEESKEDEEKELEKEYKEELRQEYEKLSG